MALDEIEKWMPSGLIDLRGYLHAHHMADKIKQLASQASSGPLNKALLNKILGASIEDAVQGVTSGHITPQNSHLVVHLLTAVLPALDQATRQCVCVTLLKKITPLLGIAKGPSLFVLDTLLGPVLKYKEVDYPLNLLEDAMAGAVPLLPKLIQEPPTHSHIALLIAHLSTQLDLSDKISFHIAFAIAPDAAVSVVDIAGTLHQWGRVFSCADFAPLLGSIKKKVSDRVFRLMEKTPRLLDDPNNRSAFRRLLRFVGSPHSDRLIHSAVGHFSEDKALFEKSVSNWYLRLSKHPKDAELCVSFVSAIVKKVCEEPVGVSIRTTSKWLHGHFNGLTYRMLDDEAQLMLANTALKSIEALGDPAPFIPCVTNTICPLLSLDKAQKLLVTLASLSDPFRTETAGSTPTHHSPQVVPMLGSPKTALEGEIGMMMEFLTMLANREEHRIRELEGTLQEQTQWLSMARKNTWICAQVEKDHAWLVRHRASVQPIYAREREQLTLCNNRHGKARDMALRRQLRHVRHMLAQNSAFLNLQVSCARAKLEDAASPDSPRTPSKQKMNPDVRSVAIQLTDHQEKLDKLAFLMGKPPLVIESRSPVSVEQRDYLNTFATIFRNALSTQFSAMLLEQTGVFSSKKTTDIWDVVITLIPDFLGEGDITKTLLKDLKTWVQSLDTDREKKWQFTLLDCVALASVLAMYLFSDPAIQERFMLAYDHANARDQLRSPEQAAHSFAKLVSRELFGAITHPQPLSLVNLVAPSVSLNTLKKPTKPRHVKRKVRKLFRLNPTSDRSKQKMHKAVELRRNTQSVRPFDTPVCRNLFFDSPPTPSLVF